jgi:hypothetical protein
MATFVLDEEEVDFLAHTFYRERLGTKECAFVCLGPAWKHNKHKEESCEAKVRQEREQEKAIIQVVSEIVKTMMEEPSKDM